tara:strand:+ start:367 stop:3213 length:2847 start_codon:yes stop_codon:yes gene_type:complete
MIYPNYVKQSPVLGLTSGAAGGASLSYFTHTVDAAPPGGGGDDLGSVYFDGNGDYLSLAASNDFDFGTGDFTIEGFFYKTTTTTLQTLLCSSRYYTSGNNGNWILRITDASNIAFAAYDGTGNEEYTNFSASTSVNTWYHFALVREGTGTNQTKFYLNGALAGSMTVSKSLSDAGTNGLRIGEESPNGPGNNFMNGYLSNIRIIKGTALYTSNFTAPTSSLTAVTNTKLLCCQSTTDATAAAVAPGSITANGNAAASSSTPFGKGSVSFDGNNDYLSIADSPNFNLGSGDFTIEAYVYANSFGSWDGIIGQWPQQSGNSANSWVLEIVGGSLQFYYVVGSTLYGPINGGSLSTGTWHHVAAVRSGNTMYMFKDGVMYGGSGQSVTHTFNNPTSDVTIGGNIASAGYLNGNISNLRLVKGTALYTSNFTPSTSPLIVVTNTKLLCCQSDTSPTVAAVSPGTITNNGSTADSSNPFINVDNLGSVLFDQTSDYLSLSDSSDFNLGTGDFTIECFISPETLNTSAYSSGFSTILDHDGGTNNYTGAWFAIHQNNKQIYWASNNANQINGGQLHFGWNHVAVVRSGSTTTLYVNGSSVANYTDNLNYTDSLTRGLYIGTQSGNSRRFGGYISNLRLVKGTAVYTSSNITVPTAPLTEIPNTKLLCCQSDTSPTAAAVSPGTITNNGSTVSTSSPFALSGSVDFTGDPSQKDYLNVAKSSDFDFSGVFTLEAWAYFDFLAYDSSPTGSGVDSNGRTKIKTIAESINWNAEIGQYHFGVSANNKFQFYIFDYPSSYENRYYQGNTTIQTGQWYHFMVNRDSSNDIRLYVNGTRQTVTKYINGSSQGSSSSWNESTALSNSNQPNPLRIGATKIGGTIYGMDGKISNLRMTRQQLYGVSSNIPVPTSKLLLTTNATASNVKLLCCQDLNSATSATKSPTSITANNTPTVSSSHPF